MIQVCTGEANLHPVLSEEKETPPFEDFATLGALEISKRNKYLNVILHYWSTSGFYNLLYTRLIQSPHQRRALSMGGAKVGNFPGELSLCSLK